MENFYFGQYAHLERILHPLILTLVVGSTDVLYFLENNSLPLSNSAYLSLTSAMYLGLFLVVGNSVKYRRSNDSKEYFKWRLILLLAITSFVRVKETMITALSPAYEIHSLIIDVIYILEVHFGSIAIIEDMERNTFHKFRDTDMDRVFSKQWTFLGFRLRSLLLGQVVFSLQFLGIHVFYYFLKMNNPEIIQAKNMDIWYNVVLQSLPFICLVMLINKFVLVVGVRRKSTRTLTYYYYSKSVLIIVLRLTVVAMIHMEYSIPIGNTPFARTIAKLTVLPTGYIFQFEIAQVLRWITYFSLEAQIPVGQHPPKFSIEYSPKTKEFGFFQIAETNKHLMDFLNSVKVPKKEVTLGDKLGEGEFAIVYNARIKRKSLCKRKSTHVAVKVNKNIVDALYFKAVCSELKTLHAIGQHPNLVRFIGVTKVKMAAESGVPRLGILTELCSEGNLLTYLRYNFARQIKHVEMNGKKGRGFERVMRVWSYQISSGMEFLSRKKIIHGDLAARNILLNDKLVCKISDFGMSCRLYIYQVYATSQQDALPLRWMAPETLNDFKFSLKSDIWSFGVLLWEIFSCGDEPYENELFNCMSSNSTFVQRRKDGNCLEKPAYCSTKLYNQVMKKCWEIDPGLRPDFGKIAEIFSTLQI